MKVSALLVGLVTTLTLFAPQDDARRRKEEAFDYYGKWLKEDVVYIISPDEKAVFQGLATPAERDQFIEQFWFRRDPDPLTTANEFKEEHYRRIAYANENFTSGIPGWRTDRGQIYIIHGEPAEVDAHPNVGNYERTLEEGGGSTAAFPFEIWRYRHIEGLGSNIEIEFVDPTMSGEYRLALRPEEKDALLFTPGTGLTLAETGLGWGRADRPYFNPGNRETYPYLSRSSLQNPFARYERLTRMQIPPSIKYQDLKELVKISVGYESIPLEARLDYFRLNDSEVLVPLTLEIRNKSLAFEPSGESQTARVSVYGVVTTQTNRVVAEFEEDIHSSYRSDDLAAGLRESSIYQKILVLESRERYKLDLVIKDQNSNQFGIRRLAVNTSSQRSQGFAASSLILSNSVSLLETDPRPGESFVLGNLKVMPSVSKSFSRNEPLWAYVHLYNFPIDSASLQPLLKVRFRMAQNGTDVWQKEEEKGESFQFSSPHRIVIARPFEIAALPKGNYTLLIEVGDLIGKESISLSEDFTVDN